jgi:hypothetical protein
MKEIDCYKIDVEKHDIHPVKVSGLEDYYREIGNDCNTVEIGFRLENGDMVFCDEEGLFHDNIGGSAFKDSSGKTLQILHGNCLLIGVNEEGEETEPKTTLSELMAMVEGITAENLQSYRDWCLDEPVRVFKCDDDFNPTEEIK